MNLLFAHHVELQHVPVLAALFAVGCWLGWHLVSKVVVRLPKRDASSSESSRD